MYSLYWLGVRITLKGADELHLLAIEVRKATKSIESTKYGYLGGRKVSSKSQIVRRVSKCVEVRRKIKEQGLFADVGEKRGQNSVMRVSDERCRGIEV